MCVVYCILLINKTYMHYSRADSLEVIRKWTQIRALFALTTQTSQNPHRPRHSCTSHDHTGWLHIDPRCAQRLGDPQAVPALGTFCLFLCETAHQKCSLWKEQTHREPTCAQVISSPVSLFSLSLIGNYKMKHNILYCLCMEIKGTHTKNLANAKENTSHNACARLKRISLMDVYFIMWEFHIERRRLVSAKLY